MKLEEWGKEVLSDVLIKPQIQAGLVNLGLRPVTVSSILAPSPGVTLHRVPPPGASIYTFVPFPLHVRAFVPLK